VTESYTLLNSLYVLTEGSWLHLDNDTVRVDVEHVTKLRVPLHHLSNIVAFGDSLISPALLARAMERGIAVAYFSRSGRFIARVDGPLTGNVYLRRDQHLAAADPSKALSIARALLAGKIRNSRTVLLRGARDAHLPADRDELVAAARHLNASLRTLKVAPDLDAARGIEGDAARVYFAAFPLLLRPDLRASFPFDLRSRRPPRNALNALLSFLYAMLTHDCRGAAESVGLDPQVGLLHALRPGRPALALDLVEEFRAVLADRTALTLINRGQLRARDFHVSQGGAVQLMDDARKLVLSAWQERKRETVRHPILGADVPLGLLAQLQARLLARVIRGELDGYVPYLHR
jgi:CRISPR-associated protein Cas1